MPPLRVPEDGLLLSGPPGDNQSFPTQAFAITLSDDIIEDLIRSAQNGEDIQLSLGSSPALQYGSRSHTIPRSTDTTSHDFYLTQPFTESIKRARKVPNTTPIFMKPKILAQTGQYKLPKPRPAAKTVAGPQRPKAAAKSGASPRLDSGLEALQNSLAHAESQKNHTLLIDGRPGGVKKGKSKLLASVARASSAPRSMPGSPATSVCSGSPSHAPVLSASQQAIERGKGQRISIIHELAAQDQTFDYLQSKWSGKPEDFSPTLRKVADFNEGTQKWIMLSKTYWKELDVWNYEYDSQELRQKAIDNAVRHFDKSRVSPGQPEWELLLPKEERGKGKCLSILQANLTRGPGVTAQATPKIKVQKADEGAADSSKDDNDSKGAAMTRSVSSPLPVKKKISEREAQQKRLLKHKPGSAAPAPARRSASPIKGKVQQVSKAVANGATKVLSQEFVADSDSDSEDQVLASKPKVMYKVEDTAPVLATPAAAPAAKPKPKPKPKPRLPAKPPAQASSAKRRRDDDDGNSSSSGMPLSKRMKQKPANVPSAGGTVKQRQSDSSQKSRSSTTGPSYKSKNTSPAKSSPLATSPPTNASDLDQPEDSISARPARPARPAVSRKRPLEREREREHEREEPRAAKKQHRPDVPDDLFQMAHKFKVIFEKYEEMHWELTALENPPRDRVDDLVDMRTRLKSMREDIYREYYAWRV